METGLEEESPQLCCSGDGMDGIVGPHENQRGHRQRLDGVAGGEIREAGTAEQRRDDTLL